MLNGLNLGLHFSKIALNWAHHHPATNPLQLAGNCQGSIRGDGG
jgi:hypothetical protein